MYRIVLDNFKDIDGPYEVDANLLPEYANVDKTDLDAMRKLAADINYNYDGTYLVVDSNNRPV